MPRLFVAVDLPETLKTVVTTLPGKFGGARWVEAGNLHLTVRFIGEMSPDTAERIAVALEQICSPAFDLQVTGLGRFPPKPQSPPRVLWIGLSRPDGLQDLYETVEDAITALGMPRNDKPFTPHVTLVRIPSDDNQTTRRARRFLELNAGLRSEPFPVTAFHLIESRQTPNGVRYTALADYPLTA